MERRVPARLTPREGRRFAFPVGTAFLALAGVLIWRDHVLPAQVFGAVGGSLWIAGLLIPGRLGGVYGAWMGFAHAISRVTTPVFMGIVYYVVIAPIGFLRRNLGRNPMVHAAKSESYWLPRDDRGGRGDLNRQF